MDQPRKEDGTFKKMKSIENQNKIEFELTEYQCRIIGNRMRRAEERYSDLHSDVNSNIHQECGHWADTFLSKANRWEENGGESYEGGHKRHLKDQEKVKIKLTPYECWSIGLRLFEIGEWFGEKGYEGVKQETQWMARKFHAEKKDQEEYGI